MYRKRYLYKCLFLFLSLSSMKYADYELIRDTIPTDPGIYQFKAEDNTILYVGKAKNIKKRVASYFTNRKDLAYKTRTLVKMAHHLEFIIVHNESDALLLENTLIKRHLPRFNVMLKDGKNYTYLCIKNEPFPRVFFTRRVIRDGSTYFGPYTSKARTKIIMDLIRTLFPIRTCNYPLTPENIAKGKYKICLEYHIKRCNGPCEGLEDERTYLDRIQQVSNVLKGNFGEVKRHLNNLMDFHVENLEFEKAQSVKKKLAVFEDYQAKSTVVSTSVSNVDVFSLVHDDQTAFVNYLRIVNGAMIYTNTFEFTINLDAEPEDILTYAVDHIMERYSSSATEIIVPIPIEVADNTLKVIVPKIGDKKKLLDLSMKNAQFFMQQLNQEKATRAKRQTRAERVLTTLQKDLQMDQVPFHIECFDNSNIQGSNPVASCVVFKNAKPSKSDYRKFNIKSVEGPNDFASMKEVVFRRYRRMLDEETPLPELIVIDGGKGQLNAAVESLQELGILSKVTVIGIAKRLEEIFMPGDPYPLYINKKSESLILIQQIRNEAHRFAITFHRNQRSKNFIKTELTEIPGIGGKTSEKLLKHFHSVRQIKKATLAELEQVIGKRPAVRVKQYFGEDSGEEE